MRKLILVIVGVVALTTGCNMRHNQQIGSVTGAVAGGLLGNTIGKGSGRIVSTAIGTFLGTIAGSEIGKSMDRPPTVVYRTQPTAQSAYGVCADITNVGAKSSCKRSEERRGGKECRSRWSPYQ